MSAPSKPRVDGVRQRIEQLNAMQPIIEKAEAAALADTRARLAEEQRKRLGRALGSLLKNSMQFSAVTPMPPPHSDALRQPVPKLPVYSPMHRETWQTAAALSG